MKNEKRRLNGAPIFVRVCVAPGCRRLTLRGLCGPCFTLEELRRIFSAVAAQDRP